MTNTNLVLKFPEYLSHHLFSETQISKIESLHIPTVIRFMLADRFDTKFINSTSDTWSFIYSGLKNTIKFDGLDYHEAKLLKYFLAYYIQINSPSSLYLSANKIKFLFSELIERNMKFLLSLLKLFF